MGQLIGVSDTNPAAVSFLLSLDSTVDVSWSQQPSQMNLQLAASISPNKGLVIMDLRKMSLGSERGTPNMLKWRSGGDSW